MVTQRISDAALLAQIPAARARERQARRDGLRATAVRYQRSTARLVIDLTNGGNSRCRCRWSRRCVHGRSRNVVP